MTIARDIAPKIHPASLAALAQWKMPPDHGFFRSLLNVCNSMYLKKGIR